MQDAISTRDTLETEISNLEKQIPDMEKKVTEFSESLQNAKEDYESAKKDYDIDFENFTVLNKKYDEEKKVKETEQAYVAQVNPQTGVNLSVAGYMVGFAGAVATAAYVVHMKKGKEDEENSDRS